MTLIAATTRTLAIILYVCRNLRVSLICVGSLYALHLIHLMTRSSYPYRAMVLPTETYGVVSGSATCRRFQISEMRRIIEIRIVIVYSVTVRIVHYRKLRPRI